MSRKLRELFRASHLLSVTTTIMLRFHLICACWLLISVSLSAQAALYEVAQRHPHASDDGFGSAEQPLQSIGKAAQKVQPGDVVLVRDGVYRERVVIKTSGTAENPIRFQAAAGAEVLLTAADRLSGWQKVEPNKPVYQIAWPHMFITWSKHMTHPDDEYHRLIGRCEQVAIDGYLLHQVLEATSTEPRHVFRRHLQPGSASLGPRQSRSK